MNDILKEFNNIDWDNDFAFFDYDNKIDDYDNMIKESYNDDDDDDDDIRGY